MPTISELLQRYFVQPIDLTNPEDDEQTQKAHRMPATSAGNLVDFFIDGVNYFGAIRNEVENLRLNPVGGYFYFANWLVGLIRFEKTAPFTLGDGKTPYTLLPPTAEINGYYSGTSTLLIDDLDDLAAKGVDVRSMVYVNPLLFSSKMLENAKDLQFFVNVNRHSLLSINELRNRPGMQQKKNYQKLLMNTLCHPMGAMHLKIVVCGNQTGMRVFVGGLDLVLDRLALPGHRPESSNWHDAGVRIAGPAAGHVYEYFRSLYNEQMQREIETFKVQGKGIVSHYGKNEPLSQAPASALQPQGHHHVQVLRTLPQMNFAFVATPGATPPTLREVPIFGKWLTCLSLLVFGFRKDPLSFAPDGVFEFRTALRKAISNAQKYIYIEDQGFYSSAIMHWVNQRLKDRFQQPIKVIIVHGADPADGKNPFIAHTIRQLADEVDDPDRSIAFIEVSLVIHSKLTIIDDQWVAIGSANAYRRSLYTDGECSVSVLDEVANPIDIPFAQKLRIALWQEHCGGRPTDPIEGEFHDIQMQNIDSALSIWGGNPASGWWTDWGVKPNDFSGNPIQLQVGRYQRKKVPLVYGGLNPGAGEFSGTEPEFEKVASDQGDADSRLDY